MSLKAHGETTTVTTFYKVDALSYVAEGLQGEMLANMGGLPHRIVGQDPSALDGPITPTDVSWVPEVAIADDREASRAVARRVVDGPSTPTQPLELTGWRSWQELKAGYRESYATIAESLKRQAEEEWKTDALARDSGEGLVEGRSSELALLYPQAEFRLSGEGSQFVRSQLVTTSAGNQKLVLTAVAVRPGVELPLTVDIHYPSAPAESVRFIVLAREDVSPAEASTSTSDGSESLCTGRTRDCWGPGVPGPPPLPAVMRISASTGRCPPAPGRTPPGATAVVAPRPGRCCLAGVISRRPWATRPGPSAGACTARTVATAPTRWRPRAWTPACAT